MGDSHFFDAGTVKFTSIERPPYSITIMGSSGIVMSITPDGRLVPGEGLSADEATQGMFAQLQKMFERHVGLTLRGES